MAELSAEFKKWWADIGIYASYMEPINDDIKAAFLAGAAIGAKREQERIVELLDEFPVDCFCEEDLKCGPCREVEKIIDAIRREDEGV